MNTLYNSFLYIVQQMSFAQFDVWLQKKFHFSAAYLLVIYYILIMKIPLYRIQASSKGVSVSKHRSFLFYYSSSVKML